VKALSAREKKLLILAATLAVLVFGYNFIVRPLMDSNAGGAKQTMDNATRMKRMSQLYEEYKKIRLEKTRYTTLLENKTEKTTEIIQQCATSNNIDKNIGYTRKSQSNVQNKYIRVTTDVKLEGVAIGPLTKFIFDMENSNDSVRVQYLRITKGLKGTDTYDAIIKIDSFTSK
jgi:hypothetical protein